MIAGARELAAVVLLIHQECMRLNRPWDPQGIFVAVKAAIEEDNRHPGQVVSAGIAAARDTESRTPGSIRWESRYTADPTIPVDLGPACYVCSKTEKACRAAAAKAPGGHEFTLTPSPASSHLVHWAELAKAVE